MQAGVRVLHTAFGALMHVLVLQCMKIAISHSTVGNAQHLDTLGLWSGLSYCIFYQLKKFLN